MYFFSVNFALSFLLSLAQRSVVYKEPSTFDSEYRWYYFLWTVTFFAWESLQWTQPICWHSKPAPPPAPLPVTGTCFCAFTLGSDVCLEILSNILVHPRLPEFCRKKTRFWKTGALQSDRMLIDNNVALFIRQKILRREVSKPIVVWVIRVLIEKKKKKKQNIVS